MGIGHDRPGTLPRSTTWATRSPTSTVPIGFYEALRGAAAHAQDLDVPYVGEIVGYPDVVAEGAFFRLPGGVVLELLEYKPPYASRGVDMESYNAGRAPLS